MKPWTRSALLITALAGSSLMAAACGGEEPETGDEAAETMPEEPASDDASQDGMGEDGMRADESASDDEMESGMEGSEMESELATLLGDDPTETAEGLRYTDLTVGEGTEAAEGNTVSVHYTGTFEDGGKFDSSLDRGTPFSFTLGRGEVIQGWDLGVQGMRVGGTRVMWIPSELAYGEAGHPAGIAPNTPLLFQVELLDVQ